MALLLSESEANDLEAAGTSFRKLKPEECKPHYDPEEVNSWYGFYSDCGNLVTEGGDSSCAVYDSPTKPQVCSDFKMGGEVCMMLRATNGL